MSGSDVVPADGPDTGLVGRRRVELAEGLARLAPTAGGCRGAAGARVGLIRGPIVSECPTRGTGGHDGPMRQGGTGQGVVYGGVAGVPCRGSGFEQLCALKSCASPAIHDGRCLAQAIAVCLVHANIGVAGGPERLLLL